MGDEPVGIGIEHGVVAFEGAGVSVEPSWQGALFDRQRVKDGWREVDDLGAGGGGFFPELEDACLMGGHALLGQGEVNTVIHAVAGDDEFGLGLGEHTVEALV